MKQDRCGACGGTELVDAVDNFGRPYKGCARCTIVLPPELAYPPVQACPICGAKGKHVGKRGSLALDAECTSCGFFYTTTARRAVLASLSR